MARRRERPEAHHIHSTLLGRELVRRHTGPYLRRMSGGKKELSPPRCGAGASGERQEYRTAPPPLRERTPPMTPFAVTAFSILTVLSGAGCAWAGGVDAP